jgi:hypothetical protein
MVDWVGVGNDGHVTKWYDQSGNDNHAVQATPASQPKVVEGGVLVADGLKFDGVDDYFDLTTEPDFSGKPCSIFTAQEQSGMTILGEDSNRKLYFGLSAAYFYLSGSQISETHPSVNPTGLNVFSSVHNGTAIAPNLQVHANGQAGTTQDADQNSPMAATPIKYIGRNSGSVGTYHFNKDVSEIIIYNSDQTANRKAIESNMADYHGNIDLPAGFDSGNDEVDGYVATWYDQSGNGNNAVQAVATSQPKIVEGGTLLADGIQFDGGQALVKTTFTQGQLSQPNTAFVVSKVLDSGDTAYVFDGTNSVTRNVLFTPLQAYHFYAGSQKTIASQDTNQHLFTALFNTTNSDAYLDGVIKASSVDVGLKSMGGITIGARYDLTDPLNGTISEIIIYDSDQSAFRKNIEFNINNAYSI